MAKDVFSTLYGYVFDGSTHLERACVDRKTGRIINAVTSAVLAVDPRLSMWYTYKNVERALARLQGADKTDDKLAEVSITQDLIPLIGSPRLTRDHLVHMLSAGGEKWLGRKYTTQEIKAFETTADGMVKFLEQQIPKVKSA